MTHAVVPHADKMQLARFLSGLDADGRRIAPSYRSVLFLLVDCAASRHWSSDRIAAACGVTVRTVTRAFAYWRARGVLELRRRKRLTAEKSVNVDAALCRMAKGVAIAKAVCAVARRKASVLVRTLLSDSVHLGRDSAPWREPGPPSASLKRLLKRQEGRSPG